jgi:hypothetical protein
MIEEENSSTLETLMEGYEEGPIVVEAIETDTSVTFKVKIDKAALVAAALPALIAKLSAPKAQEGPAKAPRKPRSPKAAPTTPETPMSVVGRPGELPGQMRLPLDPSPASSSSERAPSSPPQPSAPTGSTTDSSTPSEKSLTSSVGEKGLLHGIPIITTPGEGGLAATKARMEQEALAKKKAEQEAYAKKLEQVKKMQTEAAKVAAGT